MAQTKIKLIADGVIDVNNLKAGHTITTDNIGEGTNLYYTDARVGSYLSANSYATEGYVTTAVSNLVDAAPSTLDTLNELAAALGDDPNFATTVTNSIATKLPLAGGTLTGNLTVGTNTLFVDAANNRVSVGGGSGGDVFTIFSAGYPLVRFNDDSTTRGLLGYVFDWGYFGLQSESNLVFRTGSSGGAERMRIDTGGNVGIGTSTVASKLTINTSGSEKAIAIQGYNNSYVQMRTNTGFSSSYNDFSIFTNSNAAMSGQGNTSIPSWLISLGGNETTADTFSINRSPAGSFSFSQLFSVNGLGNVGIGTSSPTNLIHTYKGTDWGTLNNTIIRIQHAGSGGTVSNPTSIGDIVFSSGNDEVAKIRVVRNRPDFGNGSDIVFFTNDGSSNITATERLRLKSGGGLTFNGDTAAANALDDYEEGTWTPIARWGLSTGTATYTSTGRYTKVGNVVHLYCFVEITNIGNASGQFNIFGLPFISGSSYGGSPVYLLLGRVIASSPVQAYIEANQIQITFEQTNNNVQSPITNSNVTTSSTVFVRATYTI